MAADSPAEKMLINLLIRNKLMTKSQLTRVIKKSVGQSEFKLHEEILQRRFVDPKVMNKIVAAIDKKGHVFPLLCDQSAKNIENVVSTD
ncbi:MAG: hypothetical protein HQL32_08930 [Planctomycetes bacterium]|nr:hypothetical protein [Planctomycetota bacterium]